jgi:hypothetical protein
MRQLDDQIVKFTNYNPCFYLDCYIALYVGYCPGVMHYGNGG